jgi:hypothetical protein
MNGLFQRFLALGCICAGLGWFASSAGAGVRIVETLEWVIADSDQVVRGTLAEVKRVRDKNNLIWATVTVKVADTFKGEKKDELKFMASYKTQFPSERLVEFERNQTEALICLVKSQRYKDMGEDFGQAPWALRLAEGEVNHTLVDVSANTGAFVITMDGQLLNRRDPILQAAAAAGKIPAADKLLQSNIRAPGSTEVVRKLTASGPLWLLVPVDSRLETQAKSWLKAMESESRVEGVKALRHFKSDDAIALLKPLLEDAQSQTEGKVKYYPVRKAAFDVLKGWGVAVKAPVTEEPAGK